MSALSPADVQNETRPGSPTNHPTSHGLHHLTPLVQQLLLCRSSLTAVRLPKRWLTGGISSDGVQDSAGSSALVLALRQGYLCRVPVEKLRISASAWSLLECPALFMLSRGK